MINKESVTGLLVALVSPSGGGKSIICDKIPFPQLVFGTTRKPRNDSEVHGKYAYFLDLDSYRFAKYAGKVMSETFYDNHWYWSNVLDAKPLFKGEIMCCVADEPTVNQLKGYLGKDNVISIYLDVPITDLKWRMFDRGDSNEDMIRRIERMGEKDFPYKDRADFVVKNPNGELYQTIGTVTGIALAVKDRKEVLATLEKAKEERSKV
jgi:guanylate kinase